MPELRTAPELGAEFLDRVVPGWFWRVDARTLEMQGWGHCVLSQLAPNSSAEAGWAYATRILNHGHPGVSFQDRLEAHAGLRAYGFAPGRAAEDEYWDWLNKTWQAEIRKRRATCTWKRAIDPLARTRGLIRGRDDSRGQRQTPCPRRGSRPAPVTSSAER